MRSSSCRASALVFLVLAQKHLAKDEATRLERATAPGEEFDEPHWPAVEK